MVPLSLREESPTKGPTCRSCLRHCRTLNRAWQRLARESGDQFLEKSLEKASRASSVFAFGDKTFPSYSDEILVASQQGRMRLRYGCQYFDLVTPTFRFLHRGTVTRWLDDMYQQEEPAQARLARLPTATAAVVLMIFAEIVLFRADVDNLAGVRKENLMREGERHHVF